MSNDDRTAPGSGAFSDNVGSQAPRLSGDTGYEEVGFSEEVGIESAPVGDVYEPVTTSYVSPASASAGSETPSSTTDVAKDQAQQVGQEAVGSGQHVAGVAADQAKTVAAEAGTQAKNLLGEARTQLTDQAATQQNNLAVWLRDLAEELGSMVDRSHQSDTPSGTATHLAGQASGRVHSVASWLEDHEPSDAIGEVSRFARQRPGLFLALAAVGGLVAGRLTRGLTSDSSGSDASAPDRSTSADTRGIVRGAGDPYAAPLTGNGYAGGATAPASDDSYWAADEQATGARDDDFGLPEEPSVLGGDRGYAAETARPYDQDPR